MKLFLDTANLDQIREACRWGIVDGATTNPTLVSKTGREPRELYAEICGIVPGPVSLECMATDAEAIVAEARQLATIADNVVVKVPLLREGLIAVKDWPIWASRPMSLSSVRRSRLCWPPSPARHTSARSSAAGIGWARSAWT